MKVPPSGQRPSKDCVAEICKIDKVTVPIVVYVAMLVSGFFVIA